MTITSGRGQRFRFAVTYFAPCRRSCPNRAELLLVGVEPVELRSGGHSSGRGAESAQGRVGDGRVLKPDHLALEVGRATKGLDTPSTLRIGPGSTPIPTRSSSPTPSSISLGDPLLEDLRLEVVAVDEQRRDQRLEARHPDRVEGAGAHPGQVDLAGLDVVERPDLIVGSPRRHPLSNSIVSVPSESRPTSSAQLVSCGRFAAHVGQSEDARLALVRPAGLVAARAAARGQGEAQNAASTAATAHRRFVSSASPCTSICGCLRRYGRTAPCTSGRSLDPWPQAWGYPSFRARAARKVWRERCATIGTCVLRYALWPVGLALGAFSLALARDEPLSRLQGISLEGAVALLGAGWALARLRARVLEPAPGNAVGPLLVAAGSAWFLAELDNPGVGSPVVFTSGWSLSRAARRSRPGDACLPGRPAGVAASSGSPSRSALAGAYSCSACCRRSSSTRRRSGARNARTISCCRSEPGPSTSSAGSASLGLAWSSSAAVAAWRAARSRRTRLRVVAPVVLAGRAYLALVAGAFATSLDRAFVGNGELERRLWLGQAAALPRSGCRRLGPAWRRTRTALARLVVELGESAPPGGLRDGLADALGDPELELAYPVGEGRYIDARGRAVDLAARTAARRRRSCAARHRRRPLHRPGPDRRPRAPRGGRRRRGLALENERLQAEARAQLEELRSSRARIVEAGDAERRRLERDLHDGAQQRLVVLSLALRLLRAQLGATTSSRPPRRRPSELAARSPSSRARTRHPPRGSHRRGPGGRDRGARREAASASLPCLTERFAPAVEAAAYFSSQRSSSAAPQRSAPRTGRRAGRRDRGGRGARRAPVDLEDRVGALDGASTSSGRRAAGSDPRGAPMRVVVADDAMLLREGLARLLADAGFESSARPRTAGSCCAGRAHPPRRRDRRHQDAADPHRRRARARRRRSARASRTSACSCSRSTSSRATRCGCSRTRPSGVGYLLKDRVSDIAVLADALRRIDEGECVLDPTIVSRLLKRPRERGPARRAHRRASARCSR